MTNRDIILARLYVLWSRTLEEHKLGFDEWVKKHAA